MYGRLINCRGTCVLKGNVYGVTQMSAYCIISAGYVLWGEYWLPKYCRGICKVERTTDFTTLQGHVLVLFVLEVVDVHVGQGVVVCTVLRTNICILEMHTS